MICYNVTPRISIKKRRKMSTMKSARERRKEILVHWPSFYLSCFLQVYKFIGIKSVYRPSNSSDRRQTRREVRRMEEAVKFEYNTKHIRIQKCNKCCENRMSMVYPGKDVNKTYKCDSCKNVALNHYEDKGL